MAIGPANSANQLVMQAQPQSRANAAWQWLVRMAHEEEARQRQQRGQPSSFAEVVQGSVRAYVCASNGFILSGECYAGGGSLMPALLQDVTVSSPAPAPPARRLLRIHARPAGLCKHDDGKRPGPGEDPSHAQCRGRRGPGGRGGASG